MNVRALLRNRWMWLLAGVVGVGVALIFLWAPLVSWFTLRPMGGGHSPVVTEHAGALTLAASVSPDPPQQQGNTLTLTITDGSGKPVDGAQVAVDYDMPAMGGMAEMRGGATVSAEGKGRYRASFGVPMSGNWTLVCTIHSSAGDAVARFKMTVGSKGLQSGGAAEAGAAAHAPPLAEALPPAAVTALDQALDGYARVRELLAGDKLEGIADPARALAVSLHQARAHVSNPGATQCLESAATAAERLTTARSLPDARAAFAEVNRWLLPFIAADAKLAGAWHLFECPMVAGHPRWAQRSERPENPYVGAAMPTCATPIAGSKKGEDETAYFTCSMHPTVKQNGPGTCPICGMNLVAVKKSEQEEGIIVVPAVRRQEIGVRTGKVVRAPLAIPIRAVGHVNYDETQLADVSLKVEGWIGKLHVNETGQYVKKGDPLFTVYSPALFAAEQEYLIALHGQSRSPELIRAAAERLKLWNLSDAELRHIAEAGHALEQVPIFSQASGYVVEKNVVEGAAVQPGQRLFRIAALGRVWVEAEIYEADLPLVAVGQKAKVTLDYLPGKFYEGRIAYVYPYLDTKSRTGQIRVELRNDGKVQLKPGMYAHVELDVNRGLRLQVPESAVVYTGPRRLVFVDLGGGRLRPQEVELGQKTNDAYEVLAGLKEGDVVVTSGNFLIAAESRIRSAAKYWEPSDAAK